MKKLILIVLSLLLVTVFVVGCADDADDTPPGAADDAEQDGAQNETNNEAGGAEEMPDTLTGTIEMEDGGIIEFELYHDIAPESVRNFVYLARSGFYDGLTFHRIISGFMIQGGCPDGTGTGNPGWSILGEFSDNGVENDLSHTRGVISMARAQPYNSAGSQFFICHGDPTFLDNAYAAFGLVTSGMDVVDRLADTPVIGGNGTVLPENMPVIARITIDFEGAVPEPNRLGR
ncbi:MAG: peptidylprolyl isomerase [Oscillospiraceae bacterium]|nr:peptidylprolyl isomerase [Oscillospiraceae bacterium]